METLKIHVSDTVTVYDVVNDLINYVVKVVVNFVKPKSKKVEKEEVVEDKDNKSPPDLEVSVKENIKVHERIS